MKYFKSLPWMVLLFASPLLGADAPFVLSGDGLHANGPYPEVFVMNGFGCTGSNQSPPLRWSGAPSGTESFAITLFDRDERSTPSGWWHWVIYDIPAGVDHLPQNAGALKSRSLPVAAKQGRNDDSVAAYEGPCPDAADPPHHYVLTIYALKTEKLAVPLGATGANVTSTAKEFILAQTTLVALHSRAASAPR